MLRLSTIISEKYGGSIALSGCGFLIPFHLGVLSKIMPDSDSRIKYYGCSGGSLAAIMKCVGHDSERSMNGVLQMSRMARNLPLSGVGQLEPILRQSLGDLPETSPCYTDGTLNICVATLNPYKLEVISRFDSKLDLINAAVASCYVPFYLGGTFATGFRGQNAIDPGLMNPIPPIKGALRVLSFHSKTLIKVNKCFDADISFDSCSGLTVTNQQLFKAAMIPGDDLSMKQLFAFGRDAAEGFLCGRK